MKPKILLSFNNAREAYLDAINNNGAIAAGKYLPEISTDYDGLLLCGGEDVEPSRYNEEKNGTGETDLLRDECEFALLDAFVKAGKPVFGICRGHQLINVYFGGSLIQNLPNANEHRNDSPLGEVNTIDAVKGSICEKLYGEHFLANSFHHQAVKKAGKGFKVTAMCKDVIEATEHESLPVFSVQWHPERMCSKENPNGLADGNKMFKYFIDMCKK